MLWGGNWADEYRIRVLDIFKTKNIHRNILNVFKYNVDQFSWFLDFLLISFDWKNLCQTSLPTVICLFIYWLWHCYFIANMHMPYEILKRCTLKMLTYIILVSCCQQLLCLFVIYVCFWNESEKKKENTVIAHLTHTQCNLSNIVYIYMYIYISLHHYWFSIQFCNLTKFITIVVVWFVHL